MQGQVLRTSSALVLAIAVIGPLSGCATTSIAHLSGPEWMRVAEQMPESMRGSIYIGSTGARAYLESWRMSIFDERGETTVYWTEVSELPDGWLAKVKPGRE